jgi:hypothetical protein
VRRVLCIPHLLIVSEREAEDCDASSLHSILTDSFMHSVLLLSKSSVL